jgi:FMN phosphatase YigB (HAD superfamily)
VIRAKPKLLFFDVGETLVSEERDLAAWAAWFGVPASTFFSVLGAVIEARQHHEEVFRRLRPGIDLAAAREERRRAGVPPGFIMDDLYPDTLPALRWAQTAGFRLGFAGNHSQRTEEFVRALGLSPAIVGSSQRWGVAKPDPAFFRRIIDEAGLAPHEIVYIGDRIDNDVLPALRLGMGAIFVERGPWGTIQSRWPEAREAPVTIRTLAELPDVLTSRKKF